MHPETVSSDSTAALAERRQRPSFALGLLVLLMGLSGCTPIPTIPYPTPSVPPPEPIADASDAAPSAPPSVPPATPAPAPAPRPAPVPAPTPQVLVIRSSDADNYLGVAESLSRILPENFDTVELNLASEDGEEKPAASEVTEWTAAVAIGADAAVYAASELNVPTIFCQIFDYQSLLVQHENLIAVEPLPPLELQLRSWKAIDPGAESVGIIVTADDDELVADARAAADTLGMTLHVAVAVTDRDAIYQFKRFAQSVDGLWLQPNSQILSPTAIREMLDYALGHQVQTIVFSPSLLEWGALLSVGSSTDDVAATVAAALGEVVKGELADTDRVRPLSTVDIRMNEDVAGKLGIADAADLARARQLVTSRDDDT